jgi:predicted nucleic acid-binding protein
MNDTLIIDSSCLIVLERIKRLDILHTAFSKIVTTREVRDEFGSSLPAWIEIMEVYNKARQQELESFVDKGEASVMALALESSNAVLVIDEKKGRRIAKDLQLEIIGTLKVLLIAKQKGITKYVAPLIDQFRKNNFRVDKKITEEILREAGEK